MQLLREAVAGFLHHCRYEKNLGTKTLKAYSTDLEQFTQFIRESHGEKQLAHITKTEVRAFIEYKSQLKPKSLKRKIATLKAMFNFLEFEDRITINPFRKMRIKIREPHVLPPVMNFKEITAILKLAYKKKKAFAPEDFGFFEAVRNIAVLELLFSTGCRVSEITGLKPAHIDLKNGNIIINGKGGRERIIQVCSAEPLSAINEYDRLAKAFAGRGRNSFLVNRLMNPLSDQSVRNMVKKFARQAQINRRITPHTFRHSFATLLLERDVDIKYIQAMLGHSSILTTQIYTHVNRAKQRKILFSKHPRRDVVFG